MKQRQGSREVALTTLIDLLVQIVFVFTLLLIVSGAIQGAPEARGYIQFDDWKSLVSIFDVDPMKSIGEQAKDIEKRYQDVKKRRDELEKENGTLRSKIGELDKRITELENQRRGAPGYPPCRAADGSEILVIRATIDASGDITAALLPAAHDQQVEVQKEYVNSALSRKSFQQAFDSWRRSGLSRDPQCKFTAIVQYDPEAAAGDYQPAISAIWYLFRVQQITKATP